jgi:hypothetical protein
MFAGIGFKRKVRNRVSALPWLIFDKLFFTTYRRTHELASEIPN